MKDLISSILRFRDVWAETRNLGHFLLIPALLLASCAQDPQAALNEQMPKEFNRDLDANEPRGGSKPPTQPASGPSGSNYPHKSFKRTDIDYGSGKNTVVEIREPAEPSPANAPVVVYIHGWTTEELIEGGRFQPFLEHTAKHGYISVLVRYGDRMALPVHMENQAKGIKAALDYLKTKGTVKPDGRVAFTGSSLGGSYIFQLAHNAERLGVPVPKVIGAFDPAGGFIVNLKNLSNIPSTTRVVIVPSETEDVPVGGQAYENIWKGVEHILPEKKLLIMPLNDGRGTPKIYSNHSSCINARAPMLFDQILIGAEDWYGCWKPVMGAIDYEFGRGDKKYIDPANPEVRNMGTWSDGVPVKRALINDEVFRR